MKTKVKLNIVAFCMALTLISCSKEEFNISSKAKDLFHVKNGDYLIPVMVRGNTASKKIILFIQGGPGSNTLDFATVDYPGWKNTLEKEYAVAYYEQRGMGNMQGNFSLGQSIISAYIEDLHKVAMFLEKAYNAEIIMLGHSFGGGLMYRYMIAKGNSGIPIKYISANAPVSTDTYSDSLRWKFRRQFLFNTATLEINRANNINSWNEVLQWLSVTPVIKKMSGDDPYKLFKQWNDYVNQLIYAYYPEKSVKVRDYLKVVFSSPYNPLPAYLAVKYKDEIASLILREEEEYRLMTKLSAIDHQSILLFTGRYDDTCVPEELSYIFTQISSPLKKMEIIDYAGHEIFTHQPVEFTNKIKLFVQ